MPKSLMGVLYTDNGVNPVSRQATDRVEFYARPLKYGDLSEVSLTVWQDGKVHLTIKDEQGNTVDSYSFGRDRNTESPRGWDQVTA